jgi:hypothetical protein
MVGISSSARQTPGARAVAKRVDSPTVARVAADAEVRSTPEPVLLMVATLRHRFAEAR